MFRILPNAQEECCIITNLESDILDSGTWTDMKAMFYKQYRRSNYEHEHQAIAMAQV